MSSASFTTTQSATFTVTHARHVVAKIGTDLKRMQRFYQWPSDNEIADYEREAIALLQAKYLDWVIYGFTDGTRWRVALKYAARYGGILIEDSSPGRVPMGVDVTGCSASSLLAYTRSWNMLDNHQQASFYQDAHVSFQRTLGSDYHADWRSDRTYSANGRGVLRHSTAPPQYG
ncbi:MAG: hypothetical protein OXC19_16355 [Bryobacterales bacterium]|nr:hypothetical protein [Bryobacterales bacterium]